MEGDKGQNSEQKPQSQPQKQPVNEESENLKQVDEVSNKQQLYNELISMGFQQKLIKEAIAITLDKDKALQYIISNLDENDDRPQMKEQNKDQQFQDVEEEYKMVFLVRMDLKMGLGKIAAQVGHATLRAYKQMEVLADQNQIQQVTFFEWLETGQKKIVVKVNNEEQLLQIVHKAHALHINNCYIRDAGLTQIQAGSVTVAAIGPAGDADLKGLTGHLKLL